MSNPDEWGPWIDHDGKGCPCRGQLVESCTADGVSEVHIAGGDLFDAWGNKISSPGVLPICDLWDWGACRAFVGGYEQRIIRYRVRKPKGLIILQELLENLPSDVKAREPA